jgi:Ca2+-binding RTX toxin-like protein
MSLQFLNVDDRGGWDLAVANAGSDSVSVLLGDGHGGFRPGGTFPVGRRPVALVPAKFDAFFGPDLVVVNRGSDNMTALMRHEVGRCMGRTARLRRGTGGPDLLRGREGPDELHGRGGEDEVVGAVENDCLYGEGGDDVLQGGSGDDLLVGGPGDDLLACGQGTDTALTTPGDRLVGCERRR